MILLVDKFLIRRDEKRGRRFILTLGLSNLEEK